MAHSHGRPTTAEDVALRQRVNERARREGYRAVDLAKILGVNKTSWSLWGAAPPRRGVAIPKPWRGYLELYVREGIEAVVRVLQYESQEAPEWLNDGWRGRWIMDHLREKIELQLRRLSEQDPNHEHVVWQMVETALDGAVKLSNEDWFRIYHAGQKPLRQRSVSGEVP